MGRELMGINWKGVIGILIIILLCVAALCVVNAYAAEIPGGAYANVIITPTPVPTLTATPSPTPTPTPVVGSYAIITYEGDYNLTPAINGTDEGNRIIEVYQGDTVYWNDTCDLRLVEGWYGKLVHKDTGRIVDISSYTRKILIDPATFTPGEWDQWSDFDFDEKHGNTVAFHVKGQDRPKLNFSEIGNSPQRVTLKPYIQPIPVKHVTDYLVAHGDSLNITTTDTAKIWMFGRTDGYYGIPSEDNVTPLSKGQIQNLTTGNYILVIEQPVDGRIDVNMRYDPVKDRVEYFDPVQFEIKHLDFFGLDPKTRLDKFRTIQKMTKDKYYDFEIVIEEPSIEIISLDQVYFKNQTASQTIRGYTNVAIGTPLKVIVDKDQRYGNSLKYSTFTGVVKGNPDTPGDMRWFEISIPLLFDNFAAGHHTIEVSTAIGGSMSVDYDVYEAPEHSFIPNNTIKYVNGSEWRPDPLPKIIEKEVIKTVEKRVEVPIPPSQEQVTKGQYDAMFALAILGIVSAIILGILGFLSWYFGFTYARYKQRREEEP